MTKNILHRFLFVFLSSFGSFLHSMEAIHNSLVSSPQELGLKGFSLSKIALSKDESTLAVGGLGKTNKFVALFDATAMTYKGMLNVGGPTVHCYCMTFSPDGKMLFVAVGSELQVWDLQKSIKRSIILSKKYPIDYIAAYSTANIDETILYAVVRNQSTVVLQFSSNSNKIGKEKIPRSFSEPTAAQTSSPNGKLLVFGMQNRLLVHCMKTGKDFTIPLPSNPEQVSSVAFSKDSIYCAAGTSDGQIFITNPESSSVIDTVSVGSSDLIMSIAFNNNTSTLFVATANGSLYLLDITKEGTIKKDSMPKEIVVSNLLGNDCLTGINAIFSSDNIDRFFVSSTFGLYTFFNVKKKCMAKLFPKVALLLNLPATTIPRPVGTTLPTTLVTFVIQPPSKWGLFLF